MGQYYKAVVKNDKEQYIVSPMDYRDGFKLMEHAYGGDTVRHVMSDIQENPSRVWWVGDYSDTPDANGRVTAPEIYAFAWSEKRKGSMKEIPKLNYYKGYLVNHTKRCFVCLDEYYKEIEKSCGSMYNSIAPLPMLTAIGNGNGGGDYYNEYPSAEDVGAWAGDLISWESQKPEGYGEYECLFYEE